MHAHTAPGETGGNLIEFTWKRPLRETTRWVTGVGLAGVGVAIAVIGTASNSYLSMPLGIAIAVLGAIVLVLYAVARSRTKPMSAPVRAGRHHGKKASKVSAKESVASDLALVASLYSQGALTSEEYAAAKRRILGI
jgi:hypothetical protein